MGDAVNHPSHYADGWSNGAEVIDITENLNFNRGNAVKYIARAGKKNADKELEDLEKGQWYLTREIERFKRERLAELEAVVLVTDNVSLEAFGGETLKRSITERAQELAEAGYGR